MGNTLRQIFLVPNSALAMHDLAQTPTYKHTDSLALMCHHVHNMEELVRFTDEYLFKKATVCQGLEWI